MPEPKHGRQEPSHPEATAHTVEPLSLGVPPTVSSNTNSYAMANTGHCSYRILFYPHKHAWREEPCLSPRRLRCGKAENLAGCVISGGWWSGSRRWVPSRPLSTHSAAMQRGR